MKYMLESRLIIRTNLKKKRRKKKRPGINYIINSHRLLHLYLQHLRWKKNPHTNDERICSTRKTLVDDEEVWLTVLSNTCWRAACCQRPENSIPQLSLLFFSFLEGMAKNRLILEMI